MEKLEKEYDLLVLDIKHQMSFIYEVNGFDCEYLINTIKQLKKVQKSIKSRNLA